jgi:hypothetical protein
METCGIALTILTCIFGILCRIFCFGRGLSHYLRQIEQDSTEVGDEADPTAGVDNADDAIALGDEEAGKLPHSHPTPSMHSRVDSEITLGEPSGSSIENLKHLNVEEVMHPRDLDLELAHQREFEAAAVHQKEVEADVLPQEPEERPAPRVAWFSPWGSSGNR